LGTYLRSSGTSRADGTTHTADSRPGFARRGSRADGSPGNGSRAGPRGSAASRPISSMARSEMLGRPSLGSARDKGREPERGRRARNK
jgi:hypothetical protein